MQSTPFRGSQPRVSSYKFRMNCEEFIEKGEHYTIVFQVKPAAKAKNFRIPLDLSECGKCHNPEYACTCDG